MIRLLQQEHRAFEPVARGNVTRKQRPSAASASTASPSTRGPPNPLVFDPDAPVFDMDLKRMMGGERLVPGLVESRIALSEFLAASIPLNDLRRTASAPARLEA